MTENLLKNGGFEADWGEESSHRVIVFPKDGDPYETERGEFHTPPGWLSWFYHDPDTWDQPEVGDIHKAHAPYRIRNGEKAAKVFTFFRKHDAGFMQQISVESGQKLCLSAWAHAWSNHGSYDDDPHWSEGAGYESVRWLEDDIPPLNGEPQNDSMGNFAFMVGIDPEGGRDPFAETVAWGDVAYIYNGYHQVPAVEATARGDEVTVFLRSRTKWPFKHNDAYWDDIKLVLVMEEEPPEPPEPVPTEWHYPVIERGSKIGVHAIYANSVPAFARELEDNGTRFAVVKAVDDLNWLQQVKELSPDTIIIGRFTSTLEGCENVDSPDADIDRMATDLVDVILDRAASEHFDVVDYWEIVNEPDPPGASGYRALSELMIACMEEAEEHGLKLALFGLNAGTPEWDEMEAMANSGVFGRAKQGGHILTLHEGTFTTYDPQYLWGETIPGSPIVEGAGAMNFRYRYLYHLLEPRDECIPLVVSEWYCEAPSAPTQALVDALRWYDSEASKDYYFLGVCPFTLGPTPGWEHTDFERVYPDLVSHMVGIQNRENAVPPEDGFEEPEIPDCVPPRVPYRRSYILLPQISDPVERLEWRTATAIGSSEAMETVGHSADDAGVGPRHRRITVINPTQHGGDLKTWYKEHYPGALYREIEADTPWEAAIHLLPPLHEDIAVGQRDPRWESYDFGEEPGGDTIGGYGGLLTGLTIILRSMYGRHLTPPHLDKLLVAARAAFIDDNVLVWDDAVTLFSAFDDSIEDDNARSVDELEALWDDGWEIILRQADDQGVPGERFVYLERIMDGVLHIIDTWDGERKQKTAEDYVTSLEGIRAAHLGHMPVTPSFELLAANVDLADCVPPREPYDRTYLLLPQLQEMVDRLDWRVAAAIGASDTLQTFGHSADDAGTGPPNRRVVAVNPDLWGDDLAAWYEEHYERADYEWIVAEGPWEMAIRVLPALEGDIALAQTDPRWADYDFGEHPDVGGETIGRYGCFLTGLSMILRKTYRRDVTPPLLDKLLVAARSAYVSDNFMAWGGAVPLFSAFDDQLKDNEPRSASELKRMLDANWEVILRRADGQHFVYLEHVEGDTLHIIDTWDGRRKEKSAGSYVGVRAAHLREGISPPVAEVLLGLHDEAGGEWMVDQGMVGCCLVHRQVQLQPALLDFRHLQEAGVVVIARLNWGYADGTGTFPRPAHKGAFVDAVVETILSAKGVDFFHVGNEPNNRQEWPGFGSSDLFTLTAQYVTQIYNDIWHRVDGRARIGPPPIDPYFGPGSNNREWWTYILEHIDGADALFLHSKTQTNDPDEVWSTAKFSDWPLEWQYLHLRTVETGLEVVPSEFRDLPVFVTELNPQNLDAHSGIGWRPDNDAWVRQAVRYFREAQPVTGVVFYRYEAAGDQAPFGLETKPLILAAIDEEAKLEPAPALAAAGSMPHGLPSDVWRRVVEALA